MIDKIIVGLMTLHTPATHCDHNVCNPFNTDNDLIVVQAGNFFAGRMINSYFNESFIGGMQYTTNVGRWDLSAGLGFATNYPVGMLPGGKPISETETQTTLIPVLSTSFNLSEHVSFEMSSMLVAINFGIGIKL